jgi:glycosyltransferase involved in cell wall biosynthesis
MKNKIRILYDYQIFLLQNYGGISRYHVELINQFHKNGSSIIPQISMLITNNLHVQACEALNHHQFLEKVYFPGKGKILKSINNLYTKSILISNSYDIFHPTYYNPYFIKYLNDKPFVLTVHDLIYQKFNNELPYASTICKWFEKVIYKATKIIAVSHQTKKDLKEFYDVKDENIEVVYHGTSISGNITNNYKLILPDKYLLYIGHRSRRKNFDFLVTSITDILIKNPNLHLVCAGGDKFSKSEEELFKQLGIENKILYRSFNNDNELVELYKRSILFIYPSKYEGFGIPIIEAFQCKCPVALSNTSCFPEIAGSAGLYFDPYDSDSIKETIGKAIGNRKVLENCVKMGLLQVQNFSWAKAAEHTQKIYESLI